MKQSSSLSYTLLKMEVILSSSIKVPNAVIVSGLLESPEDEEIVDFLKKYGSVRIVEYQNGTTTETLAPLLPYIHELKDNPCVRYYVQALSSVYTTKVGYSITKTYVDEINSKTKWERF